MAQQDNILSTDMNSVRHIHIATIKNPNIAMAAIFPCLFVLPLCFEQKRNQRAFLKMKFFGLNMGTNKKRLIQANIYLCWFSFHRLLQDRKTKQAIS
jgi:hypothetical protein